MVIEKCSVVDALYMTLITISTLGMRASEEAAISMWGRVWIMVLIAVGIALAMISLSIIVGLVVEGNIRSVLGRRQVNRKIGSLEGHIIVCGYGRMGRFLCQHLRDQGKELVVIDASDQCTSQAEDDGMLYILGDAGEEETLRAAGIEKASALVASLSTDADNVFLTLVARDLNRKLFITARAERSDGEVRLIRAGANKAICPQVIGATRVANILTRPGVVDFVDFAMQGLELEAEQFVIGEESKLVGKTLRDVNLPREVGLLVIAIRKSGGHVQFNPGPDTLLEEGDTLIVTGQVGSMAKLEEQYS
jgi:voltage-gated potassium channel